MNVLLTMWMGHRVTPPSITIVSIVTHTKTHPCSFSHSHCYLPGKVDDIHMVGFLVFHNPPTCVSLLGHTVWIWPRTMNLQVLFYWTLVSCILVSVLLLKQAILYNKLALKKLVHPNPPKHIFSFNTSGIKPCKKSLFYFLTLRFLLPPEYNGNSFIVMAALKYYIEHWNNGTDCMSTGLSRKTRTLFLETGVAVDVI